MEKIKMSLEEHYERNARSKKMLLWFAMISMFMMFAGLTSAYVVSTSRPDWVKDFELPQAAYLKFSLYDVNGKLVDDIVEDRVKAGQNKFGFNVSHLAAGVYFLQMSDRNNVVKNEKIIVNH